MERSPKHFTGSLIRTSSAVKELKVGKCRALMMYIDSSDEKTRVQAVTADTSVEGRKRKAAVRSFGEAAERASCWLWNKREEARRKWAVTGRHC